MCAKCVSANLLVCLCVIVSVYVHVCNSQALVLLYLITRVYVVR